MRRRELIVSMAALEVLSGCLRLQQNPSTPGQGQTQVDPSSTTPTSTRTHTTSKTPTEKPQSKSPTDSHTQTQEPTETSTETASAQYPLGLDAEGPEPLLAEVHRNELIERSFEVRYKLKNVSHGTFIENYTQRASPDYRIEINHGRQNNLIRFSTSNDDLWWQQEVNGELTYGYNHWGQFTARFTHYTEFETYLKGTKFGSPEIKETADGQQFILTAESVADGSALKMLPYVNAESIESLDAEMVVKESGIITEFVAEFQWIPADGGDLLKTRFTFNITDLNATVNRPDWFQTAKERAPSATVKLTDDRRYVKVKHDGGNPIVASSQFAFRAPPDSDVREIVHAKVIDRPFKEGETAYVYLEDGSMSVNIGSPPASASPEELTEAYPVFAEVGSAPYFPPQPIQ